MTEKKTIREIAISHQRQMSSVHPHAIIGTIEDAINEYAAQQKPPSSATAEESAREIMMKHCSDNRLLSMNLGRAILSAMHEFATLHAQKIADKMVSERLREDEK